VDFILAFDDKNNNIEVCLFESFLSRYFLDNPNIFQPVIIKVLSAIERFIAANSENLRLSRVLFSVFSTLSEQDASITDFEQLKQSCSLITIDTFMKYFSEQVMTLPDIKIPMPQLRDGTLKALVHLTLFKTPGRGQTLFLEAMRPKTMFSDINRGVIELNSVEEVQTSNIGILSTKDTPNELRNYLCFNNFSCRQYYAPKEDSEMTKWLRAHYLPVISGASGGTGKILSQLSPLIDFSRRDYQLMGLLIASSTVALGHHSFFEVLRPLSLILSPLEEQNNLLSFYEQCIPPEIKALESYQAYIRSKYGASLIHEFTFDSKRDINSINPSTQPRASP
jgi:hypothetical protein